MIAADQERLEELRQIRDSLDTYEFQMTYPRLAQDLERLEALSRLGQLGLREVMR